ncbi:MAG: hypothetical protein J6N21_10470 [Butyrivibrio sp.]|nr:hypothetical protein [Butyrivibrio sp.]
MEEAVQYLSSLNIEDFTPDEEFVSDLEEFVQSPTSFPKRYKVQGHNYFIVIKTNVATLEEFKRNNVKNLMEAENLNDAKKKAKGSSLADEVYGWYDGQLNFRRIVVNPVTGKLQYKDTLFRALVRAQSPMECYDKIVDHLKNRPEVDGRSQYPSAKGKNFTFTYLGLQIPESYQG